METNPYNKISEQQTSPQPTIASSAWSKFLKVSLVAYLVVFFVFMIGVIFLIILGVRYLSKHNATPSTTTNVPYVDITLKPDAPALGNADAPVTVVEYADFQCPFCKQFQDTVFPQLKTQYIDTDKVKFVFQDFPFLGQESLDAAGASKCAQEQQQFWPYHDLLYARQAQENSGTFALAKLKSFAAELGLDTKTFNQCLDGNRYQDSVMEELQAGENYGVSATPTIFVNGKKYEGVASFAEYQGVIDDALANSSKK